MKGTPGGRIYTSLPFQGTQSVMEGKGWEQELEEALLETTTRKQRAMNAGAVSLFLVKS